MFAGQASFGRIVGERIQRVEGTPFDAPRATGDSVPLAGTQLLPPVLPFTFFCVGLNYRAHILHAQAKGMAAAKIPDRPEIGYRANNALTGHGQPIVMPSDFHGQLEAEGEVEARETLAPHFRYCSTIARSQASAKAARCVDRWRR